MEKLSFWEKTGFSIGELAGSGFWQAVLIFLPIFYTDVFGIPATVVGTLFVIVRIFDAINDPIMGTIADRTNHRWGKFRPWLVWSSVPFGIMAFLMFYSPDLGPSGKIVYAYVTYILMMIIYTMAMIPFSALSGVMTSDYLERTSLNSYRFVLAFLGAMIVQGLFIPMVKFFGHGNDMIGYRWTLAIFGPLCILFFLIAFWSTTERIKPVSDERNPIMDDLGDLLKNRPWVIVLLISLVTLIYISIRSAVQTYYFKYYIDNEGMVSSFMVTGTMATIVAILLTTWLTKVFDKKRLYMMCMFGVGVSSLFFYFIGPKNLFWLYTVNIIFNFMAGPSMPLLWSMMADAADYSEWKNGRRATGLVFSASTLAFKGGGAIGGAIAMFLLSYYGYQANMAQSVETLNGIRLMLSIWPAIGAFISVIVLAFYNLNAGLLKQIEQDLKARKAQAGLAES